MKKARPSEALFFALPRVGLAHAARAVKFYSSVRLDTVQSEKVGVCVRPLSLSPLNNVISCFFNANGPKNCRLSRDPISGSFRPVNVAPTPLSALAAPPFCHLLCVLKDRPTCVCLLCGWCLMYLLSFLFAVFYQSKDSICKAALFNVARQASTSVSHEREIEHLEVALVVVGLLL